MDLLQIFMARWRGDVMTATFSTSVDCMADPRQKTRGIWCWTPALYGDPAYPVRDHFISPFKGAQITPAEANFNTSMSSVKECVEWEFGKILRYFAFLDFRKILKVLLQPIAKYYFIGALLSNCHTCLYRNQLSNAILDGPLSVSIRLFQSQEPERVEKAKTHRRSDFSSKFIKQSNELRRRMIHGIYAVYSVSLSWWKSDPLNNREMLP